jgi:phosphatidylglycerophosphatase A
MDRVFLATATFFFVGKLRPAPGTWGSLAALPLAWVLWNFAPTVWGIAATAFLFVWGAWAAQRCQSILGRADHPSVVLDEVVGILIITAVARPLLLDWALAFVLFRVLDILKPGPIGWIDRHWKSGWGVMADDALAAAFGALLLVLLLPQLSLSLR